MTSMVGDLRADHVSPASHRTECMPRFLQVAGLTLIPLSLIAQSDEPVPAPADVSLQLKTEGDRHQFHLGELIPINYSYSAAVPDRYVLVSQSKKLTGGHQLEISCSPPAERVDSLSLSPDFEKFEEMLRQPCGGVGGGIGGGSGDGEQPLGAVALHFGPVPLNLYVRFRTPGTYTCVASSASITMAGSGEKVRPALLVKSTPAVLNIVDDPAWSHSAATTYGDAYNQLCRGDNVAERSSTQCFEVARRITYLDTLDSLAIEVKAFDGKNHGWDNGFWDAISHTSFPSDALRLMTNRIQDPDIEVSPTVLESLAVWDLGIDSPDAFQSGSPVNYHATAIERLRRYVRLLGNSLGKKNSGVRPESAKTYRGFAEQNYCEEQPLISKEERIQILAAAAIRP